MNVIETQGLIIQRDLVKTQHNVADGRDMLGLWETKSCLCATSQYVRIVENISLFTASSAAKRKALLEFVNSVTQTASGMTRWPYIDLKKPVTQTHINKKPGCRLLLDQWCLWTDWVDCPLCWAVVHSVRFYTHRWTVNHYFKSSE